jgi:methylmalonyl-CoA mutase C-terminal domain/subunit
VLLFGGGIIPKEDMEVLRKMGVGQLFGPGTPMQEIVEYLRATLSTKTDERNG